MLSGVKEAISPSSTVLFKTGVDGLKSMLELDLEEEELNLKLAMEADRVFFFLFGGEDEDDGEEGDEGKCKPSGEVADFPRDNVCKGSESKEEVGNTS